MMYRSKSLDDSDSPFYFEDNISQALFTFRENIKQAYYNLYILAKFILISFLRGRYLFSPLMITPLSFWSVTRFLENFLSVFLAVIRFRVIPLLVTLFLVLVTPFVYGWRVLGLWFGLPHILSLYSTDSFILTFIFASYGRETSETNFSLESFFSGEKHTISTFVDQNSFMSSVLHACAMMTYREGAILSLTHSLTYSLTRSLRCQFDL